MLQLTRIVLLLGHAHKSSAFFLTVTHYHTLLGSIREFSMENLTVSFSCVNMKIQQVSKIVPRVICLVLLYNLVPWNVYDQKQIQMLCHKSKMLGRERKGLARWATWANGQPISQAHIIYSKYWKKKKKIHKHTQPSRVCLVGGWKSMRLEKILVFLICVLLEVEN